MALDGEYRGSDGEPVSDGDLYGPGATPRSMRLPTEELQASLTSRLWPPPGSRVWGLPAPHGWHHSE